MPKDNIERAIKRATEKDQKDYKEIVYEGYGPHGIGILIETATDNHQRTVANLRRQPPAHGSQPALVLHESGLLFGRDRLPFLHVRAQMRFQHQAQGRG